MTKREPLTDKLSVIVMRASGGDSRLIHDLLEADWACLVRDVVVGRISHVSDVSRGNATPCLMAHTSQLHSFAVAVICIENKRCSSQPRVDREQFQIKSDLCRLESLLDACRSDCEFCF